MSTWPGETQACLGGGVLACLLVCTLAGPLRVHSHIPPCIVVPGYYATINITIIQNLDCMPYQVRVELLWQITSWKIKLLSFKFQILLNYIEFY